MTDRIALSLGLLIAVATLVDILSNGGGVLLFLMKKFFDLVEYLAFWR